MGSALQEDKWNCLLTHLQLKVQFYFADIFPIKEVEDEKV